MPPDQTRTLSRQFLRLAARPDAPPDRDLLGRFAASRDEEAFAELVRRHGPTVLAACRRVTGHAQDAEDAFQAAFLVLARRAAQIASPELLSNWLYGVAVRTGLEARAARRRGKEQPVSAVPDLPARESPDDPDLRAVIDEELARLPEKYRAAVVLCELEGLSRRDAAARLQVPEGTLSSRLAHARKVLAGRLARRGVTASAAAVGAALSRDAAATGLSAALEQATVRAAARLAVGGAVPPDLVSSRVSSLTDGVMKAMFVNRLKATLGVGVLAFGLVGLAASGVGQQPAPRPARNADPFAAGQQPRAKAPTALPKEEKLPSKGIDDDDVPYAATPTQAVVRVEDGKLVVRQRHRGMHATTKEVEDTAGGKQTVVSYENKSSVGGYKADAADVAVFDMKGNRLPAKAWRDKLKTDQHVLLAVNGALLNPRELALFKDDVLLVVLPAGSGAPANWGQPAAWGGAGYNLRSYYEPVTDPDGTTRYEPRTVTVPAGQSGPIEVEVEGATARPAAGTTTPKRP
jgi:RNA polymerase sigma factor (sigma-70 family)